MIINIWSTPRTGSTWFTLSKVKELEQNHKVTYFTQYLNYVRLINYIHPNHKDFVYSYVPGCRYIDFQYDHLRKNIVEVIKTEKRKRSHVEEEDYRIALLERLDKNRCLVFHHHIQPMSEKAYNYLINKSDTNYYIYRENFIEQLSSYALSYALQKFHGVNNRISNNVEVDYKTLEYLTERVISWHKLDKSNGIIIKYEDINFGSDKSLPKKQNKNAFEQLSESTQKSILFLNDYLTKSIA